MEQTTDELVKLYFEKPYYSVKSVPFGLTNFTKIVQINGQKYVLRIYNQHTKDIKGIDLEVQVVSFLDKRNCSFQVPIFIDTLTADKYAKLTNGSLGAIITFLEGEVPKLSDLKRVQSYGQLVGEFSSIISEFELNKLSYGGKPFSDYYALHPLATRTTIMSFIDSPPINSSEQLLLFYKEMMIHVETSDAKLNELPAQLVHHDLLIYNLLGKQDEISGVLDFDFISVDVAFMEFTVSFNHILQETEGSFEKIEAFIIGYSNAQSHTVYEISLLSLLSKIYYIAILNIYIGQHYSGVEIESNFNFILSQFFKNTQWLVKNESKIQQLLTTHLIKTENI